MRRRGFLGALLALPLVRDLPAVKRFMRPTGAGNFLISPMRIVYTRRGSSGTMTAQVLCGDEWRPYPGTQDDFFRDAGPFGYHWHAS